MNAIQLLEETYALLSKPGVWVQHGANVKAGHECLMTALCSAGRPFDFSRPEWDKAVSAIYQALGFGSETGIRQISRAFQWNDEPGRTLGEVLAVVSLAKRILAGV